MLESFIEKSAAPLLGAIIAATIIISEPLRDIVCTVGLMYPLLILQLLQILPICFSLAKSQVVTTVMIILILWKNS